MTGEGSRCPECRPGDIDLSERAFAQIADPVAGRVPITWRLVSPDIGGPVTYRYKEGSSQWWCGIQVRNHRNPVAALEVRTGSTWTRLPRHEYNYFVSENGTGCGSGIRITDLYGETLTDSGITITPNVDQPGRRQFAKR
ncbi:expansin EXLX1 family cellulose-binding protein [Streptomyces sp. HD]|uniref:expansin EXLX1 family cellulose-binding protein n=1 Tax=Streptomyces sp. HD TaxID=3020892 RepID=UPI002330A2FB|nr:expansin EXLX1 family cellulose-binding protein [Streptomyces sp. HD]MDC0768952.1 expansin EXLX1 family cellulose-binding protein [Streptomyces sp. HD]